MLHKFNFGIFFIIGLMIFSSCEDNYEHLTETEVNIESEAIDHTTFEGIVTNKFNKQVPGATVKIIHSQKELEIITDEEGKYSIDLPMNHEKAYVQVRHDSYILSGIGTAIMDHENVNKDFTLINSEETDYDDNVLELSSSALATISGTAYNVDGSPSKQTQVMLVSLALNEFLSYGFTDDTGFFSFASEPFENYYLVFFNGCQFDGFSEQINLNNEDLDLGNIDTQLSSLVPLVLKGTITDCLTNSPLDTGEITAILGSIEFSTPISNGNYEFSFPQCTNVDCYDLLVTKAGREDETIECLPFTSDIITNDFTFCGEEIVYEGTIILNTPSETYIFNESSAHIFDTGQTAFGSVDEPSNQIISMFANGVDVGSYENSVISLRTLDGEDILTNYDGADLDPLTITIEQINERFVGSFSGIARDADGNAHDIDGTFDIKL